MKSLMYLLALLMPWVLRRRILQTIFGFELHPSSRIGFSWVRPKRLRMGPNSSIGHLTVCKGIDLLVLGECAIIGNWNWITGYPAGDPLHFSHQTHRKPQLLIGDHAAVTNRHLIDCTDSVIIGKFSTFAGFRSQILTHSIDMQECRQDSASVSIGDYCFIGTDCVLLGGASLPSYSVLAAKSLLGKQYTEQYHLYGGVPAKAIRALPKDYGYFCRATGYVD